MFPRENAINLKVSAIWLAPRRLSGSETGASDRRLSGSGTGASAHRLSGSGTGASARRLSGSETGASAPSAQWLTTTDACD